MDRSRVEAFFDRFVAMASGASAVGVLAVADRCGLLDWLGAHEGGTAEEIATGADLDLRYTTEILHGLTAARVVEHDDGRFRLPPEHALFVADETSPYFMGGWVDMIPGSYAVIERVAEAARRGGGVAFDEFGEELNRGLDRANGPSQRILLTRKWLPAVEGLIERLESGIEVADIGCGTGTAVITMATAYPHSRFSGFDVSEDAVAQARERSSGLENVEFARVTATELPGEYDLVTTFDVIHDLADPPAALRRIRDSLRPEGVYLMMEPNMSSDLDENIGDIGVINYGISLLHCMTQSLAIGGMGLGAGWGRQRAEEMAREAGFSSFEPLEDITNRFSAFYTLRP